MPTVMASHVTVLLFEPYTGAELTMKHMGIAWTAV